MNPKVDTRVENRKATVHKGQHFTDEQITYMQESANRQEKIIGRIFFNNPAKLYGPAQLHKAYGLEWPLTSTRRAFTNLTGDGILVKTENTVDTPHGRSEHQWRWKRPSDRKEAEQGDMFGDQGKNKPYSEALR